MKAIKSFTTTSKNIIAALLLTFVSGQLFSQDYGKTFVDYNAGTIQPADTLQIRATFVVRSGTMTNCSFADAVPANTSYVPGTLAILTNEGKVYKSFTDAAGDDAGTISGTNITINFGTGATSTTGGSISNTSKPSFYGGTCIMIASYKIVVNSSAAFGSTINIGGGTINYTSGGVSNTITFPSDFILLYQHYAVCSNSVGSNAISTEYSGSFGSGTAKDRGASSNVPASYTYANFSSAAGTPGDYYYGVSNNTSGGSTAATGYSTVNTWAKPDNSQSPSHRIFGLWDIIGDHTGATNTALGNPATDVNSGASGGYMLVINASYKTDTAFLDTVTNLCPNTYYYYSAWIRNMCSKCGCDSNGVGATSPSGYIPTGAGDSSGVHPNLTFNVNGTDYYTTGDVAYTGQWVQKGFVYLTGPAQTSMVISVHNNAPGGGGNDWALDDIAISSCLPTIALLPNKPDTLCMGSDDTVRFQVSSYFNNYAQWQIQQSLDGGVTWSALGNDTTGKASSGTATPVYDSSLSQYQYTITRYYRLDNTHATVMYRMVVATTAANLSSSCAIIGSSMLKITAVDCNSILPINFIYFNGQLDNGLANLRWSAADETEGIAYIVERSTDQANFEAIGTMKGTGTGSGNATYNFVDSKPVLGNTYYRIVLQNGKYQQLSTIVLLSSNAINFEVRSLVNPFNSELSFEVIAPSNDVATFTVYDMYGRVIRQQAQTVAQGINSVRIYNLSSLPMSVYSLKIQYEDKVMVKQVLKN
jgi:hypothetical protein